jgi:hypothetical protein
MVQMLLIPDPKPLDERLGQVFFRNASKLATLYVDLVYGIWRRMWRKLFL